jgi:dTDP-4-amino-4,6-dideoxygalactose transaminase
MEIAREYNLFIVEDVAQAFGGEWKGIKLGSIGDAAAFSFFPAKNLGAFGDAGAVTTNDEELFEIIKMLRVHGGRDKYNVIHIGYKARLDTLQAAVLIAKLKYIDDFNNKRRNLAEKYNKELAGINALFLPFVPRSYPSMHVYNQYTIRVPNGKRDELKKQLNDHGISNMVYYPVPLHKMKVFEDRCVVSGSLENAEAVAKSILSLPIEPLQGKKETAYVISCIRDFFQV